MMIRRTLPMVLLLFLSGCGLFSRPDNQFYSLQTVAPSGPVADVQGLPVGIEGIQLPPAIDRRGIVVDEGNHKLDVRGTEQWAAPFEDMVLHTLAFDLAARLPEGMVILPGQVKPSRASMRPIDLVVERFGAGPEQAVVLDARWTVSGVTHHERITINTGSLNTAEVVSAMSHALAELADRIVARLGN